MIKNILQGLAVASAIVVLGMAAPVWAAATPGADAKPIEKVRKDMTPMPKGWVASDQVAAIELARKKYPYVSDVFIEDLALRQQRLRSLGIGIKDIKNSYIYLDSPYVNTYENKYQPVRFMHAKHAASMNGDCTACHHYRPADKKAEEVVACRSCHQDQFTQKDKERVGVKAAYHIKCMTCHEKMKKGPVNCDGCHAKRNTDHKELVKLSENPTPSEVTAECLRCHKEAGQGLLTSAHWLWRGPSPYTTEHQKSVMSGKGTTALNNF
jgi:hypothetical protein